MTKKLQLLLVSIIGIFIFALTNPSASKAGCYNVFQAGYQLTCAADAALSNGACTQCADITMVCASAAQCAPFGGQFNNAPLENAPINAICAGANEANPRWYDPKVCTFAQKVMDPNNPEEIFGERYTYAQVNWIINSIATHFLNMVGKIIASFLIPSGSAGSLFGYKNMYLAQSPHSPLAYVKDMGNILSDQPMSGLATIKSTLAKYEIATPAHAQAGGFGFGQLNGIQTLWAASRNTAYIIMVILLLASGLAIMFRLKINPQTAISLQLMIPKIIFTLIGITFSYAIAGLVIDGVYVLISFVVFTFANAAGTIFPNPAGLINMIIYQPLIMFGLILVSGANTIFSGGILGTILGPIIAILLTVILLWLIVKVWIMMIKTYVMMIIKIILGPWQIMLGLLPGGGGFGAWLRNLISDASVFVVVPLMVVFALVLWSPPPTDLQKLLLALIPGNITAFLTAITVVNPIDIGSLPQMPILNGLLGMGGGLFRLIFGFAILSLIPKAAEMVQAALKVPPFKYGTAIGEALAPLGLTVPAWNGLQNFAAARATNPTTPSRPGKTYNGGGGGTPGGTVGGGGGGGGTPGGGAGGGGMTFNAGYRQGPSGYTQTPYSAPQQSPQLPGGSAAPAQANANWSGQGATPGDIIEGNYKVVNKKP